MGDYKYDYFQWRDPYVVRDVETGRYYMYICAAAKAASTNSIYRGCVGLAIADKITGPYELQPPVAMPFVPGTQESAFYEMERPQIIYKQGRYHLFFSCWATSLNPKWLPTVDQSQITDSTLYWYVSDNPTGPFEQASATPVVTGSNHSGIYGTNFFPAPDRSGEFIAYGWYLRRLTLAISPLIQVVWNSDSIQVVNPSKFN